MNKPRESSDDWAHLLVGLIDTELTPDELVALRHELRQEGAVDDYVDYISLHALLEWRFGTPQLADVESQLASTANLAATLSTPRTSPLLGFLSGAWDLVQGSPRTLLMVLAGLLAGYFVIVMALVPLARRAEQSRIDRGEVARQPAAVSPLGTDVGALAAAERPRWAANSQSPEYGRVRAGEHYRLAEGRVELALAAGVRVWVDGPAEFEPQSGERVRLLRGKLSAQVPPEGRGFTVATPSAEVVDLGTEFGVEVDGGGKTDVHVLKGEVEVKPVSGGSTSAAPTGATHVTKVVAGQAVRISAAGERPTQIPVDRRTFTNIARAAGSKAPRAEPDGKPITEIWLGNLFDDAHDVSLAKALETDNFGAVPGVDNLGIQRVQYGGAAIQEIAPGVRFDLGVLGWQDLKAYGLANDAIGEFAISTLGQRVAEGDSPKIDEGIGGHANFLITFDLDEIRAAGALVGRPFMFVSERAGVTAHVRGNTLASIHLAAIVSGRDGVQAAYVDGEPARVAQSEEVWSIGSAIGSPLVADGEFVRFRVALPADAKYLTLLATSAGNGHGMDGAVWARARLEVR